MTKIWKIFEKFGVSNSIFEVFHPYNRINIIWDMIHFLIILILLFFIPIEVCFDLDVPKLLNGLLILFFVGDIVINFNTSFFRKGTLVKKRVSIIRNYLKTDFCTDFISLIFYVIDLRDSGNFVLLKFLCFLRWKKLGKINLKLQEKFKLNVKIHSSVIELIKLLFFSFYILNIFACFWYYIARINLNDPEHINWLYANNLENKKLYKQYIYSLYWSAVTILTVGYGDIVPKNNTELIFTIFTIFFGCGLFAYFINAVGIIVQEINKDAHLFKFLLYFYFYRSFIYLFKREKMMVINKYLDKKHIDQNLQMRIREYLKFIWQEESTQNNHDENEIINTLSKSLKMELIHGSYGQVLRKIPLFFANFSEKFLSELMFEIKEVRNSPDEIIYTVNFIHFKIKIQ